MIEMVEETVRMLFIGWIDTGKNEALFQCPECKTVIIDKSGEHFCKHSGHLKVV